MTKEEFKTKYNELEKQATEENWLEEDYYYELEKLIEAFVN